MTTLARRARVLRASDPTGTEQPWSLGPSARQWRRIAREELAARLAGERIVREAHSLAEAIAARTREQAASAAAQAARDTQNEAEAKVAARWLVFKQEEDLRLERDKERIIAVAIVLAERLLGATLELHPARIADLARGAVAEARGASRISIEAHPLDVDALGQHFKMVGLHGLPVEVRKNAALARGELRLQTDVGTIDAKLAPQLERLAAALRDILP
ncbi:MAG: FliH/SctL family protein [Myxococcota bacterium]|nr:FliH/SctL family protein [Myxococcota bacterium]